MSEPECLNPPTTMNKWNLKAGSSGILLEIQQEQQITCFSKVIDMSLSQSQTRTKPSFRFLGPSVTKKSENVYEDKSAILVGGWNKPSEKYAHQIGAFPQRLWKQIKKSLKPPPGQKKTCLHLDSQHTTCGLPKIDARQLNKAWLGVVVLFGQQRRWWRWYTHTHVFWRHRC